MQKQSNIRILEILKYLYLRTDEEHPVTVADILDYLKGKGIHAVRQTVWGSAGPYFSWCRYRSY